MCCSLRPENKTGADEVSIYENSSNGVLPSPPPLCSDTLIVISEGCFYDSLPPHARDCFKTDSAPFLPHPFFFADPASSCGCYSASSCGCYCKYKSIMHFSFLIWPSVAVNVLHFLFHAIHGLGRGYRKNRNVIYLIYMFRTNVHCGFLGMSM